MKMSDKSTAKTMFASLCANYEGSKKVREAKALMLVHQYELFKMKDDESIEQMYSRFQTLVSGLQILKKSYVASDHVSKILRSFSELFDQKVICLLSVNDKKWVWHRRLGHANWRLISKLSKLQLVKGLPNIDYHSDALCGACQKGKIVKSSF